MQENSLVILHNDLYPMPNFAKDPKTLSMTCETSINKIQGVDFMKKNLSESYIK